MPANEMKFFALLRPGCQPVFMHALADVDPLAEALKGGPVDNVMEITEAQAAAINAAFPVPVAKVKEAAPAVPPELLELIARMKLEIDDLHTKHEDMTGKLATIAVEAAKLAGAPV